MNEENIKKTNSFVKFLKLILKGLIILRDECIRYPLYIISHPVKGWDEFKRDKRGKLWVAILFVVVTLVLNFSFYNYAGYLVNPAGVKGLSPLMEISTVALLIGVITVANWSMSTFFDGKGKMIEVFKMLCYCLFPIIWSKFFNLFISNFISTQEVAIYSLVEYVGYFLMICMGFMGFISINEFGVVRCILNLFATAIAALVICFFGILAFDLFAKMYGFISTIYNEISLRYLVVSFGGLLW